MDTHLLKNNYYIDRKLLRLIMIKGITFGAFDLFHAGHVLMFEEAKTVCEHLIVCIQTDPSIDRKNKNSPVQSIAAVVFLYSRERHKAQSFRSFH